MEKLTVQDLWIGATVEMYVPEPYYSGIHYHYYEVAGLNSIDDEVLLKSKKSSVSIWYGLKNIQLKIELRTFSDMTEDEVFEYATLINFWVEGTAEEYIRKRTHIVISQLKKEIRCNPIGFKYILEKGFDVYGLIEKGLAIDKTKIIK